MDYHDLLEHEPTEILRDNLAWVERMISVMVHPNTVADLYRQGVMMRAVLNRRTFLEESAT